MHNLLVNTKNNLNLIKFDRQNTEISGGVFLKSLM